MIRFTCQCGKKFKVEDRHAGKSTKCTECGADVKVPANAPDEFAPVVKTVAPPPLPSPAAAFELLPFDTTPIERPPAVSTLAERTLMPGEKIVCTARIHSLIFLAPAVVFVGLVVAFLVALATLKSRDYAFVILMLFLLVPLGAVLLVRALVAYWTTECVLTDKRVLGKFGFIRRESLELLLTKVEGLSITQGLLGRIFDFGSVIVSGTGGSKTPFDGIAQPLEFRRRVQEQIAAVQDRQ